MQSREWVDQETTSGRAVVSAPAQADLQAEILGAGLDLFAAYGLWLSLDAPGGDGQPGAEGAPPIHYLGVCGFGGTSFTGHVILGASEVVLTESNGTGSSCEDWMAELANQLLGRIKNRLMRRGINVHRVPPIVVKGSCVALAGSHEGEIPLRLADGRTGVLIWVDSEPAVDPAPSSDEPAEEVPSEGEVLLF